MLIAYRSTPHHTTGVTPCEAMRGITVRIKLDHTNPEMQSTAKDNEISQRNAEYKQKMKQERRKTDERRKTITGRLRTSQTTEEEEMEHTIRTSVLIIIIIIIIIINFI